MDWKRAVRKDPTSDSAFVTLCAFINFIFYLLTWLQSTETDLRPLNASSIRIFYSKRTKRGREDRRGIVNRAVAYLKYAKKQEKRKVESIEVKVETITVTIILWAGGCVSSCVDAVLMPTGGVCRNPVAPSTNRDDDGLLSSVVSAKSGCGSPSTPWLIDVGPGQRINISLIDFGLPPGVAHPNTSVQTSRIHCQVCLYYPMALLYTPWERRLSNLLRAFEFIVNVHDGVKLWMQSIHCIRPKNFESIVWTTTHYRIKISRIWQHLLLSPHADRHVGIHRLLFVCPHDFCKGYLRHGLTWGDEILQGGRSRRLSGHPPFGELWPRG